MTTTVIIGAGGRDFHDFNVLYRDNPDVRIVAFTAAQIPGIDDRLYPPSLAGSRYPEGIPVVPEADLGELIRRENVDEAVLAYSDLSYADVMHKASIVTAAGAEFRLHTPATTMLSSTKPVVAVCAVRTGCGKSQTSRRVARLLRDAGLKVVLVRHPMPYGDLEAMRVQRFASVADIDASNPTIEEREEYESPVAEGFVMYAGVDYAEILTRAQAEADVVLWDGGNNDTPFFRPDVHITVADALRPGHEIGYYPGETNMRMADVVVINKVEVADPGDVATVEANIAAANPGATVVKAASPLTLGEGPDLAGKRVLVVEDGPTLTHGGMAFGAGTVAARDAGAAELVDPRSVAVGSIAATYERYPHMGALLPAMGYGDEQVAELMATIRAVDCDVVVTGTPMDLGRLGDMGHPTRHVTYELAEIGEPSLADVLGPHIERWKAARS